MAISPNRPPVRPPFPRHLVGVHMVGFDRIAAARATVAAERAIRSPCRRSDRGFGAGGCLGGAPMAPGALDRMGNVAPHGAAPWCPILPRGPVNDSLVAGVGFGISDGVISAVVPRGIRGRRPKAA